MPPIKIDLYSDTVTPADGANAEIHVRGRGRGRAKVRRSDRQSAAGEGSRTVGQGGRALSAFGHHVQPDCLQDSLPPGRRGAAASHGPSPDLGSGRTWRPSPAPSRPAWRLDGESSAPNRSGRPVRPRNRYAPCTRVVSIEQTSNSGGGTPWPLQAIEEVAAVAREHGLILHMDGARLFNAVVATGTPARDFAAPFDTVWVDFSKGLGAPVGAVLAGRRELIEEAWVWKQRLGGAMRQAGIIAAGALYALEHHIERLAEDHANAMVLAEGLAEIPGVTLDPAEVETNLVFFEVSEPASAVLGRMLEQGVRMSQPGPHRLRAVTHLDISRHDVEEAVRVVRSCFS